MSYLGYLVRVSKKMYNEIGYIPKLRLIILYTADVKRESTIPIIDLGCGQITITEGFLSELDRDGLWREVTTTIDEAKEPDNQTIIKLMVYPQSFPGLEEKQNSIHKVIELVDKMKDESLKGFILSGMMVFCDKIIRPEDADQIRRRIMLTKVEKIIAREIQEAVDKAVEQNTQEVTSKVTEEVTSKVTEEVTSKVTEEVTSKVTESVSVRIALNMLRGGDPVDKVALTTEMPLETVRQLQATMA